MCTSPMRGIEIEVLDADTPLTKVVLDMQGGEKGLIVNSQNLCAGTNRAKAHFAAHNGKSFDFRPVIEARCPKGRGAKRHRPAR